MEIRRLIIGWWKRNEQYKNICFYCGCILVSVKSKDRESLPTRLATRDHIIPKSKGGAKGFYNNIRCCRRCNENKGADSIKMFRKKFNDHSYLFYGERCYEMRATKIVQSKDSL